MSWEQDDWVEQMLAISRPVGSEAPCAPRGSMWSGRFTGRRGTVLWNDQGLVKLSFSDTDPDAYVLLAESSLLKNYTKLK